MGTENTKKAKEEQQYDSYWKLTVEYSDIHGTLFNNVLDLIVKFIDNHRLTSVDCTAALNKKLQDIINKINPKEDMGSVRKSINQFIKLGFVNPGYKGYHPLTKKFLACKDKKERELIFTQIFYECGSLNSSYTNDCTDHKEVNFLLKTLAYNGQLTKNDLMGLMVTDVAKYKRGYLLPEELELQYRYALSINFDENKYNQIEYLIGFLKYMPELVYENGVLEFEDHKSVVAGTDVVSIKRDPILMRIYRKLLFDESMSVYDRLICYACHLPWKGLVASHIKPLATCIKQQKMQEAYDKNNGLLLSPNIDAYFDKFDITFDNDGSIILGKNVPQEIRDIIKDYQIDKDVLNDERRKYLQYHRNIFDAKNM